MHAARVRTAYQKSEAKTEIHQVKLIHLMYERVLPHLELVEQGLLQKDVKLRGENLSKAIALISELNAAIKNDDNSEAAEFLKGLYSAILVELPKVGISQNVETVRQASRYIQKLKSVWEETALKEAGFVKDANGDLLRAKDEHIAKIQQSGEVKRPEKKVYSATSKFKAAKPTAESMMGIMSVSI
nr:flagellar protein FliS [Desulfobulbaceae bacterium]